MNQKFVTWDDIFNADYPDQRLANMVSVHTAETLYELEVENENRL